MRYRRSKTAGGCYFFTANLANRSSFLLIEQVDILRQVIREIKLRHPFDINAIAILPDHCHAIWTLPQGDADFATRWRLIKTGFSRRLPKTEYRSASRTNKNERGIWQRRYWEHIIRDEDDYQNHVDYIHYNPVKHGYVNSPADWRHSSIHRHIRNGDINKDWGSDTLEHEDINFGER